MTRRRTSCPRRFLALLGVVAILAWPTQAPAAPPYSGTIFISPNIITDADPTTFRQLTDAGRGNRMVYDRRAAAFITINAYLFTAFYSDGTPIEVAVNPEFGSVSAARAEAEFYAEVTGRLPNFLRVDVQTMTIHQGVQPFGGGNNNLLIHVGQSDIYQADGILEETLFHEAAHTSMDARHARAAGWLAAQTADGEFISTYARDEPIREDIAESLLPYFAVRYRSDRIAANDANLIAATIPNRIAYFDALDLEEFTVTTTSTRPTLALQRVRPVNPGARTAQIRGTASINTVRVTVTGGTVKGLRPFVATVRFSPNRKTLRVTLTATSVDGKRTTVPVVLRRR